MVARTRAERGAALPGSVSDGGTDVLGAGFVADPRHVPGHLLALVRFATGGAAPADAGGAPLEVEVPFEPLGGSLVEAWWTPDPPRAARVGPVRCAATDAVLFGAVEADAGAPGSLEPVARELYRAVLRAGEELGFTHPVRIWNAVPRINEFEDGLERYMLFCRGRSLAFEDHYGPAFARRVPAASAVGGEGGRLVVHFVAARSATRHVENPRQVAAYAYPSRYGPRSPSFARATRAPAALGGRLFVSGTASVVGHESVHHGEPRAQLEETLRNIDALLAHAGAPGAPPALLKVYVRDPADASALREELVRRTRGEVPLLLLRGDICRRELLIEIEAVV